MIYAATGHRPDKLGGYSSEAYSNLFDLAITFLAQHYPEKIISGMALGWDQAWAAAGLSLGIPVTAAIPFYGQEKIWPDSSKETYHDLLKRCSDVVYVCDKGYAPWKMQLRNEYMVDKCDTLIALWNGSTGGTANCVEYARRKEKPIINLWEQFEATIR